MRKRIKFLISLLLTLFVIYRVGGVIRENWSSYFAKYNFEALKKVYLNSQYVSPHPSGWIPDEAVYSYAAGAYLKGVNPILVNPEQPPLGKYILSLFILLFGREKLAILVFGVLTIILFFVLARMILDDVFWALCSVALLVWERIFLEQFIYVPLLDIFQLFFIFLSFICFLKALENSWFFPLATFTLGFVMAVKFWITGFLLALSYLFFLIFLLRDERKLFYFCLSLPLVFLPLVLSYFRLFQLGGNLRQIFAIQKWIFLYHREKVSSPFSFWLLVLCNKWHIWWGNRGFIPSVQWQITWPVSIVGSLFVIILYFLKRKVFWGNLKIGVILVFISVYLLFLSFVQISPRYLLPLLPFSHLSIVYGGEKIWRR